MNLSSEEPKDKDTLKTNQSNKESPVSEQLLFDFMKDSLIPSQPKKVGRKRKK